MVTKTRISLQGLLAVSSFFLLTAAKGDGCTTTSVIVAPEPEPNPPVLVCPAGAHHQTVCDGESTTVAVAGAGGSVTMTSAPAECHDECVSDNVCGPAFHAEWTCTGSSVAVGVGAGGGTSGGGGFGGAGPYYPDPPTPGDCFMTCVPDACAPGTHAEWSCESSSSAVTSAVSVGVGGAGGSGYGAGGANTTGVGGAGAGGDIAYPPPAEPCEMLCIPDSNECPAGTFPQVVCDSGCQGEPQCWTECSSPPEPGTSGVGGGSWSATTGASGGLPD
jgi:hypothetical protein